MPSAKYDNSDGRLRGRKLQERRLRLWKKSPHCARCGTLTDYPSGFELDHRVPLFRGGPDIDSNCQVLCLKNRCHEWKTNEDQGKRNMVPIGADGWPE